jgi:hypothetical protein
MKNRRFGTRGLLRNHAKKPASMNRRARQLESEEETDFWFPPASVLFNLNRKAMTVPNGSVIGTLPTSLCQFPGSNLFLLQVPDNRIEKY